MKSTRLSLSKLLDSQMAKSIIGGDGEPNGGAGTGTTDQGQTESTGTPPAGNAGTGSSGDGGEGAGGDPQRKISALEDEKNRHFTARQQAERERDELRQSLEEKERKERTDLENAKKDLETVTSERDSLKEQVQALAVENAFLQVNDVQWHNPSRALAMVDLSEIQPDKDGKVDTEKVKAAIKKLAAAEPYLVKPKENGTPPTPASGQPPRGGQQGGQATDKAKLQQKYPALRTRR